MSFHLLPSDSRRSSVTSHAQSMLSNAASTRNLIDNPQLSLEPPPPINVRPEYSSLSPGKGTDSPLLSPSRPGTPSSLSQHYLPQKFAPLTNIRKRKGYAADPTLPKRGGGREAFSAGAARMPDSRDEDYDGVQGGIGGGAMKWNRFKWILFVANTCLTAYSLIALIFCLLTWFDVWHHADILRVGNRTELIISTVASSLGVLTSVIGWAGILLNNRAYLAIWTFLLWIVFALLVTPGYITYKRRTFNLEGKVNREWSRDLGTEGRARIQNLLQCCGYFSPFVEATVTQACYARSNLPGCKGPYIRFERMVLGRWYTAAFALVPLHLGIIIAGLLCSNHITYRFGKGMMPKAYRLSMNSMAVIMDNYANQLAEQYGQEVATDVLARSRSNLQLDSLPQVDYNDRR